MSESKLTAKRVDQVFMACLFKDGEDTTNHVKSEGIMRTVGFHPERVKAKESEIVEMLAELPDEFHHSKGGGMSFLNACMDRYGHQWGEHINIEQLFQLGIAVGRAAFLMPRAMWSAFPGGMPYCVFKDQESACLPAHVEAQAT